MVVHLTSHPATEASVIALVACMACSLGFDVLSFPSGPDTPGRAAQLRAMAKTLGCEFHAYPLPGRAERFEPFACFSLGTDPTTINTTQGVWQSGGRPFPVWMGDFQYVAGQKSARTFTFSYILLQLPFAGVPDLVIRRAGLADKVAGLVGLGPIAFESDEFSRKFHITCADQKFAFAVMTPEMMQFLLADDSPDLEIRAGYCCITSAECLPAGRFHDGLAWLERFIKLWPSYLIDQLDQGRR